MPTQVADAIREVTAKVQQAIDEGDRSRAIDADDLIEVLLAIGEELDPPFAKLVDELNACPNCGERRTDRLLADDDKLMHCGRCGANYRPA